MRIPLPTFVYGQWAIIIAVAIVTTTWAAVSAWRGSSAHMTRWRLVKLISTALGCVGIFLFLLNLESAARSLINDHASQIRVLEYMDLRFFTERRSSEVCGEESKSNENQWRCRNFVSVGDTESYIYILNQEPLPIIGFPPTDARLDAFIAEVNSRAASINRYVPEAEDKFILFTPLDRLKLQFLGGIFVALGFAGSIGEATFQLRQSLNARRPPAPSAP